MRLQFTGDAEGIFTQIDAASPDLDTRSVISHHACAGLVPRLTSPVS